MAEPTYAELHCHSHFSFLDGASAPDDLVERAVELDLAGLALTDHQGLYGAVRFSTVAEAAGLHPVIGFEIELQDAAVPDAHTVVVPGRRTWRPGRRPVTLSRSSRAVDGHPDRPRPERTRLPGHRAVVKEDHRGVGESERGPHLVLLARDATGWRSLCRLVSRANLAGSKAVPRFTQALLAEHAEGLIALSGCRHGELARRLRTGDRAGARAVAERYAQLFGRSVGKGGARGSGAGPDSAARAGFVLELSHHLLPDDDWLASETARLAEELGLPVVVTNDVHYARPEGRELQDVLTAIRHGRPVAELGDLRRPDGASYLKGADELLALPPGDPSTADTDPVLARAWQAGVAASAEIAAACRVDLVFERYRFPGFEVPHGETPFSRLSELCWEGARRRYHPLTPPVVRQLAHELDVIERTGLAEFFLICWDLMRFARSSGIPAQGRGSAADSIVAYALGITRVDPIRHELLFERFINEGRTAYPDVDIDFSSARREEVIQYVYQRYGPEHTGMVCNLVTYRARSAVREVGYALGFPRPLVDRVAKALETYDSVMVRRDLEAEGGFAQFFARPGEGAGEGAADGDGAANGDRRLAAETAVTDAAVLATARGLTDLMGQLNHERGGRIRTDGMGERGDGRLARPGDARRLASDKGVTAGPSPETGPHAVIGPHALQAATGPQALRTSAGPPAVIGPQALRTSAGPPDTSLLRAGDEFEPNRRHVRATVVEPADLVESVPSGASSTSPVRTWRGEMPGRPGGAEGPPGETPGTRGETPGTRGETPGTRGEAEGRPGGGRRFVPDNGAWAGASGSAPAIRPGGPGDDEGGPGDSPVSVRWIREGPPSRALERERDARAALERGRDARAALDREVARRLDPESGMLQPPDRRTDPGSSMARVEPLPAMDPGRHRGSVAHLSDWERWLELCARIDGFPRHLSIHSGGMLVTAAPLIDIAPIERATMPGRVVVQFDKRDVETMKLIKLDLLGLGMLAAIDEAVQLIEHDCAVCVDLDRIPEEIPEVFQMLQAADTVGVFQVESRAQMQTLPKSRPRNLDDLVVEVAIIRPGPIQGNAVHPYLRRKQGLEPISYLHPSLEPILHDSLGVILYQEQVMKIAIEVAGFTPAGSDGFRRAMGTWRSTREMEKLHAQFVEGCIRVQDMPRDDAEELFRQCAAFASFGFAKSHAAAFARTAYESSFLKLFYPAQLVTGLINAQPMGFYPVEVLVNDAKRHGVAVLPVDVNRSSWRTTTEWVGRPGWALAGHAGDDGSHDADPGEPLPEGCGVEARPAPVRSPACVLPGAAARERWAAEGVSGWGIRLGLHLVKGIGEEQQPRLDAELARGPYTSLADVVDRTGLPEEVMERLIRAGALDSLDRPRRELLWQLREVAGSVRGGVDRDRPDGRGRGRRVATHAGARSGRSRWSGRTAGRPMDLRLPATEAPSLPAITEPERMGDAYAVVGLDARRQAVGLFRDALDRLGAVTNATLADRRPGPIRIGGLVVTRQHPMTARGTVFLALEDETGMVNVTLWPATWQRLRSIVRRHALLLVDGDLQREGDVVNVIAREVTSLVEAAASIGGPAQPLGVKAIGQAGLRRLG